MTPSSSSSTKDPSNFIILSAFIVFMIFGLVAFLYPAGLAYLLRIGKLALLTIAASHALLRGKDAIFSIGFCAWFAWEGITRDFNLTSNPNSPAKDWVLENIFNLVLACGMGWVCVCLFKGKPPAAS